MLMRSDRGGVWKWILIVFLVVVLLACVGTYFGYRYIQSHGKELATGVALKALKGQIEKNLPADYDRGKVEETFKGLEQAMKEGKVKPEALGPVGSGIGNAMQDGKLTSEELDIILEDVKRVSSQNLGGGKKGFTN
jgi:hypothetical protein